MEEVKNEGMRSEAREFLRRIAEHPQPAGDQGAARPVPTIYVIGDNNVICCGGACAAQRPGEVLK